MKNTTLEQITTYIIHNNEWIIVYCEAGFENDTEDRHYAGIRREWITDGKLNREVNGLQILVSKTIEEVIGRITDVEEVDYLVEQGMDRMEACIAYFNKKYNRV